MTPLPSLGLTTAWLQLGAQGTGPEQPGLFDLVLSQRQQGADTGVDGKVPETDAPAAFLQSACPPSQTMIDQPSAVTVGVARVLTVAVAPATAGADVRADKLVRADDTLGAKDLPVTPAPTPNNNTPAEAEGVRKAPSVLPYLAQISTQPSAKSLPSNVDVRTGRDAKRAEEDAAGDAHALPLAQIWALVNAATTEKSGRSLKGEGREESKGEGEPSPAGPLAFLSGKGAKVTFDPIKLSASDGRLGKNVKETVEALLDGVPAPISHGREQVSLAPQQLAPARNENAAPPHHQSLADIDTKQLDLLMRDISELTSTAGKAAFHLSSEHLGRLQVRLETTDVGVSVAIRTDNERGHVAVSQAQKQLQDDLHANGLKVAETSVALGQSGAEQQRSDRNAHVRIAPKIDVALERSSVPDENDNERPDGRFA